MTTSLIAASLTAPLVAIHPDAPTVLHAATMRAVIASWPRPEGKAGESWQPATPLLGACGEFGLTLLGVNDSIVPFPPRVKGLPDGWVRCRDCHEATGKKTPRCDLTVKP